MTKEAPHQRLSGVFTALVTPFGNGTLDLASLERHVETQLAAGVHGLVPVGTTGEAATLDDQETAAVIGLAVKRSAGRAFVMAGAGSNATSVAIDKARRAADLGVDGLLIVTPYYNKPSQAGLEDHFAAIASAVALPIMLYNVPGRTAVELSAASCAALASRHANIIGIKEAGGRAERVTEIRLACGPDFVIHSGDDALTLPFLALGARGVTSVASNYVPRQMVALYEAWAAGEVTEALAVHDSLYELIKVLFIEANPVPVKTALALRGSMSAEVRQPLAALTPSSLAALKQRAAAVSRGEIQKTAAATPLI